MMGRQINFYMSEDDQVAIDDIISTKLPDLFVFRHRMKDRKLQFVQNTLEGSLEAKTMFLALGAHLNEIVVEASNGWYWVRDSKSPVIEYSRSNMPKNDPRGKVLRRGRVFYEPSYYDDNGALVKKNEDFLNTAQKFLGLFKKNLKFIKERGFYFGEGALKLEREGWVLPLNN